MKRHWTIFRRRRPVRRGLAVVLSQGTGSAGVPAAVVASTIKAAHLCAAGQAVIPVKVAALAEGVLKAMLLNKLKPALAVLVVAAMVGLIGYGMARGQQKGDAVQKPASEPKAPKDPVVKEKAEKEDATAWGKEVDGLQAGLLAEPATCRQGEKLKFAVKLRNVGKAEATVTYAVPRQHWPDVTTDSGGRVRVYITQYWNFYGFQIPPIKQTIKLKPGETITLYNPEVAVESEDRAKLLEEMLVVGTPSICVAPGKYKIVYGVMMQSHPNLTTGTVEFEVKPASVTAWGKEFSGLQAGLGFRSGEQRVYRHGETVPLVVRVRNVGKETVKFEYLREYFIETPPTVTDGKGKPVPLGRTDVSGIIHLPVDVNLAPGKEIELTGSQPFYELELELKPASLYETGKFQLQYERVFGDSSAGGIKLDPKLSKLATGKLELEIKSAEKK